MFWKSEEVAETAIENISILVISKVLATEVLHRRQHIVHWNVVSAEFPALCIDEVAVRIERRHDGDVLCDITISDMSAPRTGICLIRTLVVEFESMRSLIIVGFRVLRISTEEIPVLVEFVAKTCRPDVRIIRGECKIVCVKGLYKSTLVLAY